MANYKLTISYDGTSYSGWQIQPNALSIQEVLHQVLRQILQEEIYIVGSGRTDAGVHALGQVAHTKISREVNLGKLLASANSLLPKDIRILSIEKAPDNFHARYSATGKIYHYHIHQLLRDPFARLYSLYIPYPVNPERLRAAAEQFVGTHDFSSFANEASKGSAAKDPVRTIQRLDVVQEGNYFRLEFEADGFLYKMVRNITGMLLEVAAGKRKCEEIAQVFQAKDRRIAARAAPPNGLFLVKVHYDQ